MRKKLEQLIQFNKTISPDTSINDLCLHQRFEFITKDYQDRIVVSYKDQHLTYLALNQKSNALAHYLIDLGITIESLVAISVPRSIQLVIGLLGILKSGGAYVPIPPDYTEERVNYILHNAKATTLLTVTGLKNQFKDFKGSIIYLDQLDIELEKPNIQDKFYQNPNVLVSRDNLACILYTSGTTGKPKGVARHHFSVIYRLFWMLNNCHFKNEDVLCLQAPITVVDAVWDIFGSLLAGNRLVLFAEDVSKDIEKLLRYCIKHQISRITLVPSLLSQLTNLDLNRLELLKHLKINYWQITGELFLNNLIKKLFTLLGNKVVVADCYGTTEATSSIYTEYLQTNNITYKKQFPFNTKVYILDKQMNILPINTIGEIYVEGAGLARGYFDNPDLTANCFLANPFSTKGSRLYRTGDLGKYLPDGSIKLLGRLDFQVKINGFRIELEEIETILNSIKEVQQTIVLCREDIPQQKRLVGYIVPANGIAKEDLIQKCRASCKASLPNYMQIAQFVVLDAFPLLPNGKIDRQALVVPIPEERSGIGTYVAPKGLLEIQLSNIWSELLAIKRVGREDNFFELGGNSLTAVRLISRIRDLKNIEIPLKIVFENQKLEDLAIYIKSYSYSTKQISTINSISRKQPLLLSFAQQRLWFIEQFSPGQVLYHISLSVKLIGILNVQALRLALKKLIFRHESLRTRFIPIEGIPYQEILLKSINFPFLEESLEDITSNQEQEERILERLKFEIRQPFNLKIAPLCRSLLIRLSLNQHVLCLTFHHIIFDGCSMDILCKELNIYYQSYCNKRLVDLLPLPIQHADFSIWQRDYLREELLEQQLSYWKRELNNLSVLLLPTDRPRPRLQSYRMGLYQCKLQLDYINRLREFCRKKSVSLFTTLLAAFQGTLSRYTNQHDIIIGFPVANRRISSVETVIGLFANILVLRTDCSSNPTFDRLLQQVKRKLLLAYDYQDVPFEELVKKLSIPRDLGRHPLFQVMFVFQNLEKFKLGDLETYSITIPNRASELDLMVNVKESDNELHLCFEYAIDLFDKKRIVELAKFYEKFIISIISTSETKLSEIPLITTKKIINETQYNNKKHNYTQSCLFELFEEVEKKSPDSIAVVYKSQQITFHCLKERVNHLAYYLRKLGVGPEVLVGIYLPRGIELIISLLSVIKSGGGYIPLDTEYPKERIEYILNDTKAKLLLTNTNLRHQFNNFLEVEVCLDKGEYIGCFENIKSHVCIPPESLAYVIYTSGTTGEPKGVQIRRDALQNFLLSMKKTINLNQNDVLLSTTTISFDISYLELYLPLISGAKLLILDKNIFLDSKKLSTFTQKHDVSVIQATPSFLRMLLDEQQKIFTNIRKLLCGGELLTPDLVEAISRFKFEFFNLYGPTEATIWSTFNHKGKNTFSPTIIGRPICNTNVYILDKYNNLLPIGTVGELYIGGIGLARGYLGKASLTAEYFVPNHFSKNGERLYKTGDLAKYLPNGEIEFIGRLDRQVKIRGYRIELSEIEYVLIKYYHVKEAVVMVDKDTTNNLKLIAYLVLSDKKTLDTSKLRIYLKRMLVEHMVPSDYIILDSIPLLPNGKINYKKFQNKQVKNLTSLVKEVKTLTYKTLHEKIIFEIWKSLLKIEHINFDENFFDIGGHSLMMLQVRNLIQKKLNQDVTIVELFNYSTIKSLSQYLSERHKIEPKFGAIVERALKQRNSWRFRKNFNNRMTKEII